MFRSRLPESRGGRVLAWLSFALFIAVGFGWFGGGNNLARAAALRTSGVQTAGVITSVTTSTAYYDYAVQGQALHGYSSHLPKDEHSLGAGSKVKVTYLPSDPSISCLSVEDLAESGRKAVLIAAVLELILAAIFLPLIVFGGQAKPVSIQLKGQTLAGVVTVSIMALVGIIGLFFAVIPNLQQYEELVSRGKTASAAITAVYDHSGHAGRYAEYTFQVNGSYFHGKGDYVGGYRDSGPLTITYLPSDPNVSAISPRSALAGARGALLFMIVWLVLLVLFAAGFGYAVRRSSQLGR